MKKLILFLSIACQYIMVASAQVSDEFYNYFKKTLSEKKGESDVNYYALLSAASQQCFNLTNDIYRKEIRQFNERNIEDSIAVKTIPEEVMERFLKSDYENAVCKDLNRYEEALNYYSDHFCNCFTPEYAKIKSARERTEKKSALFTDCIKKLLSDTGFTVSLREKLKHVPDLASMESCITSYLNLHCLPLRAELKEIPQFSAPGNNLRNYIVDQRHLVSERMGMAVKNNNPAAVAGFFLHPEAKNQFEKQYAQFKNEIDAYRAGAQSYHIDWADSSITQCFVLVGNDRARIIFAIRCYFKIIHTELKITKTAF